ncbi:hypothetical protein [Massilia sp. TSP1-1-2]|uniref:hypothetical protein n=1 Tax=Massilia sp. TSP1-1-2 TaxID=2804649 RepID=UPI003CF6EEB6
MVISLDAQAGWPCRASMMRCGSLAVCSAPHESNGKAAQSAGPFAGRTLRIDLAIHDDATDVEVLA